jgi:hypothetical protein
MAANVLKHTIQEKIDKKPDDGSLEMTSPTSPDFGTPDYSTPAPTPEPEMSATPTGLSYDVGTVVQYKGDGLIWTIVMVSDTMLTIQNEKGETKLVSRTDLNAPPSPMFEPSSPSPSLPQAAPEAVPQPMSSPGFPPSSYDVGTVVQYKGDSLIYTIVKVSDTLLTIQNESGESKLVDRTELYAPPSQQPPLMVGGAAGGTNLYFAPSIMIGGTDVAKNGVVDMGPASVSASASVPASVPGGSAAESQSGVSGLIGGAIDFSRLVINKLGA